MQERKINTLTKDNVMSIKIDCGKTVDFHQQKMSFFKIPMLYVFQDPVKLKRCTYSLLISEIGSNDKLVLKCLFSRMDNSMIINDETFMNGKEDDTNIYFTSDKWIITVKIQGFKKSATFTRPIWKIQSMEKFDD